MLSVRVKAVDSNERIASSGDGVVQGTALRVPKSYEVWSQDRTFTLWTTEERIFVYEQLMVANC